MNENDDVQQALSQITGTLAGVILNYGSDVAFTALLVSVANFARVLGVSRENFDRVVGAAWDFVEKGEVQEREIDPKAN